jgi:hypothetical protein
MSRLRTLAPFALALCLSPTLAHADEGDGVYDRFDRDLTIATDVGGGLVLDGVDPRPTLTADLRFRIIDAAGPAIGLRWGPAGDGGSGHGHVFVGVELRPLFPALFLLDLSTGNEWVDLFVQSVGIELGAALFPFDGDFGVGLAVGLSLSVPLLLPSKTRGTFQSIALRLGARRIDATAAFQGTPTEDRSEWTVSAALSFAFAARLGAASWEPPRYRLD